MCPKNAYQASQDVSRDEHVEDVVPARGGNQPGQEGPQSRTCTRQSHEMRYIPSLTTVGSAPRGQPSQGWGSIGRSPNPEQTYGAGPIDDGCDRGEGLGVTLQALVCALGDRVGWDEQNPS